MLLMHWEDKNVLVRTPSSLSSSTTTTTTTTVEKNVKTTTDVKEASKCRFIERDYVNTSNALMLFAGHGAPLAAHVPARQQAQQQQQQQQDVLMRQNSEAGWRLQRSCGRKSGIFQVNDDSEMPPPGLRDDDDHDADDDDDGVNLVPYSIRL